MNTSTASTPTLQLRADEVPSGPLVAPHEVRRRPRFAFVLPTLGALMAVALLDLALAVWIAASVPAGMAGMTTGVLAVTALALLGTAWGVRQGWQTRVATGPGRPFAFGLMVGVLVSLMGQGALWIGFA